MSKNEQNRYKADQSFKDYFNSLNPTLKAEVTKELGKLNLADPIEAEQARLILEGKLGFVLANQQKDTRDAVGNILGLLQAENPFPDNNPGEQFKQDVSRAVKENVIDLDKARKMRGGGTHDLVATMLENQNTVIKFPKKNPTPAEFQESADLSKIIARHFGRHATPDVYVPHLQVKDKKRGQRKTPAVVQMKVDRFNSSEGSIVDASTAHPEDYLKDTGAYLRSISGLLTDGPFLVESFTQTDLKLKKLFGLMKKDIGFRNLWRNDFLPRVESFFRETGEFIDISGARNIIFYKEKGEWQYKIGSVIKRENKKQLEEDLKMLEENFEGFSAPQNRDRIGKMLDSINSIRFFNACSLACGRKKIFDIKLTSKQIQNLDRIRKIKTGETQLRAA